MYSMMADSQTADELGKLKVLKQALQFYRNIFKDAF